MRLALLLFASLGIVIVASCSDPAPYKTPKSDSQFDDPDDPGTSGEGDPYKKDAAADADASGRACAADRDCPSIYRCMFAASAGCAATGTCQPFDATKCTESTACTCAGTSVTFCLPTGYAPAPIAAATACDAGAPPVDASAD